ncbi:MAG TPA: pilus (MSHA type) biogenesis protein MshL [Ghiorsea sp.]|nr:pilus (MSHA type) biogenesis protein MshL [Ghiorsea sp.]HIP06333.1 pilus (MSHA type) biogenesis protein MshL [Mariprofundaceae bacterium]
MPYLSSFTPLLSLMLLSMLSACASTPPAQQQTMSKPHNAALQYKSAHVQPIQTPHIKAQQPTPKEKPKKPEKHYSFQASNVPLKQALAMFSRANNISIITQPKLKGLVSVNFSSLTFKQAMNVILDSVNLYWEQQHGIVYVKDIHTRTFEVNYIRMARGGASTSQAQVTSSGSGGEVGLISVSNQDQVKFWAEIETQLKSLLSKTGRVVVNRLSGTIQVTDHHNHMQEVESFIQSVQGALHRQVEIEARIVEVSLGDDKNLGIDWTRIASSSLLSLNTSVQTALTTAATGTLPVITATLNGQNNSATNQVSTVINALSEQGSVRMLSQPRLLILNNQSAMIKVGTDQPFFSQTTTPGTGGSAATVTEDVRVVTIGLVLAVTTQISADGWIMLDASPIITRLVGTATSPLGSTAPILDIKQASTLVRVRDGETVVIGGLIQDETSENERKIPLLGDIPVLGSLFTSSYKHKQRTELVIFLTPKIKHDTQAVHIAENQI